MRSIVLFALLAGLLASTGCKPPKFNQRITCPLAGFSAAGVAVYALADGNFFVLYPDKQYARVSHESCVVTQD